MKKGVVNSRKKKLGRDPSHRKALFRSLATAVIEHGGVETTITKAKLVRPKVERLVTMAVKKPPLTARRRALAYLNTKESVEKLLTEIAPKFKNRPGGYTRIVKLGKFRDGDRAEMARLEFVS